MAPARSGVRRINDLPDLGRQQLGGERLGQHLHARAQESGPDRRIMRVASDEEGFEIWSARARDCGQLTTIEAGQSSVRHQQVNSPA